MHRLARDLKPSPPARPNRSTRRHPRAGPRWLTRVHRCRYAGDEITLTRTGTSGWGSPVDVVGCATDLHTRLNRSVVRRVRGGVMVSPYVRRQRLAVELRVCGRPLS